MLHRDAQCEAQTSGISNEAPASALDAAVSHLGLGTLRPETTSGPGVEHKSTQAIDPMIEEGDKNTMKLKITFLFAVVVALFGISAASASASTFLATEYPVLVTGKATNIQGFEITGAVSVCEHGTFMTGEEGGQNPGGPSATLLIHPKYTGCHVSIGGAVLTAATVTTTGCNYVFHAALSLAAGGTVDIECEAGKSIEIAPAVAGCVISVNGTGNTGLKEVTYMNDEPVVGQVTVRANVTNISWKATSACGLAGTEGHEAKYKEGEITSLDIAKLGAGPAKAASEGLKGGLEDPIKVD
jgi:hypothetical protein